MGCFPSRDQEVFDLQAQFDFNSTSKVGEEKCISLKKGGSVVQTRLGLIQYGIPPETLKDTMSLGLKVPEYFIIPNKRFDWSDGVSLMEFEFPVYYNFFLCKQNKTKLICDQLTAANIKTIFQETLLGPKSLDDFELDFIKDYKGIPDLRAEMDFFAQNPFNKGQKYQFDNFLELMVFDDAQTVTLEKEVEGVKEKVTIQKKEEGFAISEGGVLLAVVNDNIKLNQSNYYVCETLAQEEFELFHPPMFGFTALGNSHGFDMSGSTTGFIIWINKKGIMVDPPPFSSAALKEQGIPPNFIEKIIVTHCHADHDAGAFHKIVEAAPVEFLTTPTIINSFLRKYSAVSNVSIDQISKLFQYRLIEVGHPTYILGARFTFGYSFHSIPTLCFEIEFEGKRAYFSGDTYFDPTRLLELRDSGLFSQERYEFLALRDFSKYDIIVHESGIPPIHTSTAVLNKLSEEVKEKLYLVHIAQKDLPKDFNLKLLPLGLKKTVAVIADEASAQSSVLINLNLLGDLELIKWIPFNRILEIINCFSEMRFKENEQIIQQDTFGQTFYIVKSGIVRIFSDKPENKFSKLCYRADYFGESCIMDDGFRLANVEALTEVELLAISASDFKWIFSYQQNGYNQKVGPMDLIKNLSDLRRAKEAEFINLNHTVSKMTETQKGLINMFLKEFFVVKGTVMWKKGEKPDFCFFIKSGKFRVKIPYQFSEKNTIIKIGSLLGDFPWLTTGAEVESSVEALEDSLIYKLDKKHLLNYLEHYPGFFIILRDKYVIV